MALLRASLALVEGEPLANALAGYAWWESEGHGARIAAVLVDAACNLAALAVDAGHFELAQWGLEQARLVDTYSEAITRAAMQVAAAAGDADRLRREWRECQRRIDELDPGSTPSPRTERLYSDLAQTVMVGVAGQRDL
jgi:DNA-binding SARP family transcriptional activator